MALVLGNSAYQNVAPLSNPVNDGAMIAAKLKEAPLPTTTFPAWRWTAPIIFKADGDHCSKIVCAEGSVLSDDNDCVKRRATTPKREPAPRPDCAAQGLPRPVAPQASGQIMCDDHLCRPVQRGCHLEYRTSEQGGSRMGGGSNIEICN